MAASSTPALVNTAWLKEHLQDKNIKVIEAAFTSREMDTNNFEQTRIPGSILFQQWEVCDKEEFVSWPHANPDKFQDYCRQLGLTRDDHIIVYDRLLHYVCARLWFTFKAVGHDRVSVLDGGLMRWEADGYGTDTGPAPAHTVKPTDFTVDRDGLRKHFVDFERMMDVKNKQERQIVDVRKEKHWKGLENEPNKEIHMYFQLAGIPIPTNVKPGRMSGALNVDRDFMLDEETFCFKKPDKLKTIFETGHVNIHRPSTAVCYLGLTACFIPLVFQHLGGAHDVQIYTGSWTEYGQRAEDKDIVTEGAKGQL